MNNNDPNKLAEQLLLAVKMNEDSSSIRLALNALSLEDFTNSINTDDKKKAFWINTYNAYYQILRTEHNLLKPEIYRKKATSIAGKKFSLDQMEHCILRKHKTKFSFGLIANPFAKALVKKLAVDKLDYRIHFALNCGAESCPPISFYTTDDIHNQLNQATQSFLERETTFDDAKKELRTTALLKWFSADFAGPKGIKEIFKKQLGKDVSDYNIYYKKYSWNDALANFAS